MEKQRNRTIHDARGRAVRAMDPLKEHLLARESAIDRDALDRIAEELSPGSRRRRWIVWVILPVVGLLVVVGIGASVVLEGRPAWDDLISTVTNPALIGVWISCLVGPWVATRNKVNRRVPTVMLHHRCCPHCGYGLRGLPVDATDGATVCPECACAWRLDLPQLAGRGADAGQTSRRMMVFLTISMILGLVAMFGMLVFMLWR